MCINVRGDVLLSLKRENYQVTTDKKIHNFKGTESLLEIVNRMSNPIVYFDPDVDGIMSGLLVVQWLTMLGKKFKWYINSNREHGWTLDYVKVSGKDIIAVDFIIEDWRIRELVNLGCNVVSMDHHENDSKEFISYEKGNCKGIVINNQYTFEDVDSRYLSGAGVVFESICSVCEEFNTLTNRAIVGITLLSDVRDIENPLARGYLKDLYNHKYKGYIKYLIENTIGKVDYGFGVPRMDRNFVDYKFSPAINSCLRFNQEDMVVKFALGSGYIDLGYHALQKELVDLMVDKIRMYEFSNLRVCFFEKRDIDRKYWDVLSSFVGLVASKYLDGLHSCICYMVDYVEDGCGNKKPYVRRASFRGNINGLEYRKALLGIIDGVGHGSAFGIKNLIPSKKLFKKCNKICKDCEVESKYVKDITPVVNLGMFVNKKGDEYGEINMYCLAKNRKYVKYNGNRIVNKRSGAKYNEYEVDGIVVKCFDQNVNFKNGVILPIKERGNLCMYLEENAESFHGE